MSPVITRIPNHYCEAHYCSSGCGMRGISVLYHMLCRPTDCLTSYFTDLYSRPRLRRRLRRAQRRALVPLGPFGQCAMVFAKATPRLSALRFITFTTDWWKSQGLTRSNLGVPCRPGNAVVPVAPMDPSARFNSRGYTSSCLNSKGEPVSTWQKVGCGARSPAATARG